MSAGRQAVAAGNIYWRRARAMVSPVRANGAEQRSSLSNSASADWESVKDILSSLIKHKTRADGKSWRDAHENMPIYLRRLNMEEAIQELNVIHVAGTKGKGSTCAMVESILRTAGYSTGLFTSPHLCDVRERVRINGKMVSKELFAGSFWHCYNTLQAAATEEVGMPGYFRFLTLLGLQIFLQTRPDVVILEVGIGGRIDATNILRAPAVTGITSLGFDHMELLGHTLGLIASEKAGIMRPEVPCFTVPQPPEAMQALQASAAAVGAPLIVAPSLDLFRPALHNNSSSSSNGITVGLAGDHQRLNASLAVALVQSWEESSLSRRQRQQQQQQQQLTGPEAAATPLQQAAAARLHQLERRILPEEYCRGLESASWPGRSQVVPHPQFMQPHEEGSSSSSSRLTYYLDGAHTPESMVTCAAWFAQVTPQRQQQPQQQHMRVLLFNCMKERDPALLLPELFKELQQRGAVPHLALFVPPDSQYAFLPTSKTQALVEAAHQDLSWQQQLQQVWQRCQGAAGTLAAGLPAGDRPALPALPQVPGLPPQELLSGSAVLGSVTQAMLWLEAAAASASDLEIKVLVTGSLYLVGDCLLGLQQHEQQQ